MTTTSRAVRLFTAAVLFGGLLAQGAVLTLGGYLDPNPAPGQSTPNGFVAGTLSDAGPYNGSTLFVCLDYDFHTPAGSTLTGSIVSPMSLDQIVQAVIFYSNAGLMATPLSNAVDTMAYAVWYAKAGSNTPDVLGSTAAEVGFRALVQGNLGFYTSLATNNVSIFQPNGSPNGKDPNQRFMFLNGRVEDLQQVPEPASLVMVGGALGAVLLSRYKCGPCHWPEDDAEDEGREASRSWFRDRLFRFGAGLFR